MKLIFKTTLIYLLISFVVLFISGIVAYFSIQSELEEDEIETVKNEQRSIGELIDKNQIVGRTVLSADGYSRVEPVNSFAKQHYRVIDTAIYDKLEQENVEFRFYVSYVKNHNQVYKLTLAKNHHLRDEFFESLMFIIGLIFTLILVVFLITNWIISKILWKPFFKTLNELRTYSIHEPNTVKFPPTKVYEFNALNQALTELTKTIEHNYQEQKEFTENASHEMQTPLAIIKGNLDLLIQSEQLNEQDMTYIEGIERGINKLSRLNKTLLLLSKIDNDQFNNKSTIQGSKVIKQVIEQFEYEIESKNINLQLEIDPDFEIHMDPTLAEILFSNLIQNAVRHNVHNGTIGIQQTDNSIYILNTGNELEFAPNELFERFKKGNDSVESTGLGLAIVKSILHSYDFSIDYKFENHLHSFVINFQ